MNTSWKYVPFADLFQWAGKSTIKSGDGKTEGKYKMFICSDTETKCYDEYLEDSPSLVFGTGGKASCHIVNEPFAYSTDCVVAQPKSKTTVLKFYYYYMRKGHLSDLQSSFTGSGLQHTSKKKIDNILVPVPQLDEQERIVARIEEMFSQLDAGVETLKKTKAQLAVYRQAVLKEAFDIAEKDCKMLPIADILVKNRKGMSTGPFGTMIKKSDHMMSGVPMLGIENIGRGHFVDGNKIFVTDEKAKELKSFSLMSGDIIISRSGTVGEICAVPKRAEGSLLSTNLMRVSLDKDIIRSDYFIALFQSKGVVLDQIKELCKGSTRDFLNQTILKQIVFPVPSMERQANIISVIEARMSVCDSIEKTVDTALQQAEAMRQSILKDAFEGRL